MHTFRFPLQRVLDWRETKLAAERARQALLLTEMERLKQEIETVHAALRQECISNPSGADLAIFQGYLDRLHSDLGRLEQRRMQVVAALASQTRAVLAADRDVRVLERLRERSQERWRVAFEKEIEDLAAEVVLSRRSGTSNCRTT